MKVFVVHRKALCLARGSSTQRGLSLIELMIGIALGLIIVAALIGFFVSTSRSNRELAQANRQIEAGRLSLQLLERDVTHGGFWGSYIPQFDDRAFVSEPTDFPSELPEACVPWDDSGSAAGPWSPAYQAAVLGIPILAYDALPAGCSGLVSSPSHRMPNTDVLLVRFGATSECGGTDCPSGEYVYFQSSECLQEINAGKRYVVDTDPAKFGLKKRGCKVVGETSSGAAAAARRRVVSHLYFVRAYANSPGDGIPSLVRSELKRSSSGRVEQSPPEVLVEGVEGFAVELGIDDKSASDVPLTEGFFGAKTAWQDSNNRAVALNRGDGAPDRYRRCTTLLPCSRLELANVVTMRVHVLARSLEKSPGHKDNKRYVLGDASSPGVVLGPYDDDIKRHLYSAVFRLHNISARR